MHSRALLLVLLLTEGFGTPPRPGEVLAPFPPPVALPAPRLPEPETPAVDRMQPVTPQDEVPRVLVSFNQPMSITTAPPLRLSPEPKGQYRWLDPRTLVFEPAAGRLPQATKFTATVLAEAAAVSGEKLREEQRWSFTTARPRLMDSVPKDKGEDVDPAKPLLLHFNARMDADELRRKAVLSAGQRKITFTVAEKEPGGFELQARLPRGASCSLLLPAGLRSAEGPLPSVTASTLHFRTAGKLRIKAALCRGEKLTGWCEDQLILQTTTPLPPQKLAKLVHVEPPFPDLRMIAMDSGIKLQARWPQNVRMRVQVDPGVHDKLGQTSTEPYTVEFRGGGHTRDRETLTGPQVIAPADAATALSAKVLDRQQVILRTVRLEPAQMFAALEYEQAPNGKPGAFARGVREQILRVPRKGPGLQKLTLPLEGPGLWLVEVELPATRRRSKNLLAKVVQVTGLGLLLASDEEEIVASAGTLRDHDPVPGARISLYEGPQLVATQEVDAQGLSRFPNREKPERLFLVAEAGQDRSFLQLHEFYRFRRMFSGDGKPGRRLAGGLWTDRGVYRPGDTVHAFALVRLRGPRGALLPPPATLHWKAFRGERFQFNQAGSDALAEGDAEVSPVGLVSFELPLPKQGQLGAVTLELGGLRARLEVLETRTPEAQAQVTIEHEPHVIGSEAHAEISASTWFGAPLAGARVHWTVSAWREWADYFPGHPGFTSSWWPRPGEERPGDQEPYQQHGEAMLDGQGKLRLAVPLSPACSKLGTCTFQVGAEVVDALQHGVAASAVFQAFRAPFSIALSQTANGRELHVEALALDQDGKELPQPLELRFYSMREVLDPGEGPDVEELELASARAPATFTAPADGQYMIRAQAPGKDEPRASLQAQVGGQEAPLSIAADKSSYAPGETAHLRFTGKAAGAAGLLVVDHGGIVELRPLRKGTTQLDLLLREEWLPNVTVWIAATKDGEPVAASTGILKISRDSRVLPVSIEPKEQEAVPGQTVEIAVRTAPGAGVALSVVDEGALALVKRDPPDPLEAFYGENHHDPLSGFALLQNLRPGERSLRYTSENTYGGASEGMPRAIAGVASDSESFLFAAGKGLADVGPAPKNPAPSFALRADFQPTPFFSAALVADASGVARAKVKLPDQTSTFRVSAAASNGLPGPHVGSATASIRTRLPLLLEPSLPRFVNAGDRFEAVALVHNLTGKPLTAVVRARGENLIVEGKEATLTLDAGATRPVRFDVRASSAGTGSVRFEAQAGGATDAVRLEIPMQRPVAAETFTAYGSTETAVQVPLAIPAGVLPGEGGLQITLSGSALTGLSDAARYMLDYPYDCVEQTSSLLVSLVALGDLPVEVPDREQRIAKAVERLHQLQLPDGGFSYWPGGAENPYGTAWAAFALSLLERGETEESAALLARARARLKTAPIQGWPPGTLALTELALHKDHPQAIWAFHPWREAPSIYALALFLAAMNRTDSRAAGVKAELLDQGRETAAALHFEEPRTADALDTFESHDRTDGAALYALLSAGERGAAVEKLVRGLLATRTFGHWQTTQSTAWALLALSAYRKAFESAPAKFDAGVWLGQQTLVEHHFESKPEEIVRSEVPMAKLTFAGPLVVGKEGQGPLYYRLGLTTVVAAKDAQPQEHGFRVERTLQDAEGHPLQQPYRVAAGTVVRVHLRLVASGRRSYVALADRLPAGLEPLDPALDTTARLPGIEMDWRWDHRELRDGGARVFVNDLIGGSIDFDYFARATTKGTFAMPAPTAEEMYAPETSARGALTALTVE